jgi:hypothetical protein
MAIDFEPFLICILGLAGIASFFRHRLRQRDYTRRLGATARAIPARSSRTILLLIALSLVATAVIAIGIVELVTASGINAVMGLPAIIGATCFFFTAYRESITLIGPNGFAIPYYNLYLPWSAIETVAWDSPTTSRSSRLSLHYRRPGGMTVMQLNVRQDEVISTSAMLQELRSASSEERCGDTAPQMLPTTNSTTLLN